MDCGVKCLSELGQTHAHREPRAQPSADLSASLDTYAQDIGVDVIPNWLFLFRRLFVRTSWPLYKHVSSQSKPRGREGVEDGWHLRPVSSIIVKNLDTIGFTACVKDLQPFDQHHDPITVHYIAFGGKEIKDRLIYDKMNLLSSKKGALSVHCSPLFSSSLSSFYYWYRPNKSFGI